MIEQEHCPRCQGQRFIGRKACPKCHGAGPVARDKPKPYPKLREAILQAVAKEGLALKKANQLVDLLDAEALGVAA